MHNSNLLECCIDADAIISILFGADMIDPIDPDFQMASVLYCIYVFIKLFIMMFLYDESLFLLYE